MTDEPSGPELAAELEDLRARLAEAEDVLGAIRNGEVDALLVSGERGEQVYTLSGTDRIYRQLIETMSQGAVTLSADGFILYCNVRMAEMLGRSIDQVLGTALPNYLSPADQQALNAILAQARTEASRREINLKTREGRLVPVRMSAFRLHSEGAEMVFCLVLTDLTEQKSHEQVVAAERLARLILEQAAEAIVVCDEQGRIIRASHAAQQFCDGSSLLRPFAEVFPLRKSAPDLFHLAPVLQGKTLRNVDVVLDRPGRTFDLILNAGPLRNGQQILGCVVTLTDITDLKLAEESLRLREAHRHLAQRLEALGTLAAGIAHDFNNILTAIIGNVDLARQDVGPSHPATTSLAEISKASQRAKDLVQRIFAFGRQQVQPESVIALRPVVEEALTFLRTTLPAGVQIAATFDAGAPTVRADSTQIHQVLINLCSNAWQAIEGHAGRIDIRLDSVTLDADTARANSTLRPGHFARLCVTDNGSGMDAVTLERIFDPFFTTKTVGKGTGLGLSVVHGIVDAQGGAITVTSQPGSGTTFTLYFPAAEAPEESAAPEDTAPKPFPAAGGQHVLYLDDEEALVFLATRTLERLGYRVSGYTRAEEALAAVRADPGQFDLVVTDLNMPGMSGLDVARELARLRPDLPVVLASGYITEELRAQAPKAGVRQLIYKPNTVEELGAAVQRLAGAPRRSE